MPRYLFQGSYSREGAQGLLREGGTKRRHAVEELVRAAHGRAPEVRRSPESYRRFAEAFGRE